MKISDLRRSLREDIPATQFVAGVFPRKHVSIISSAPGVGKTWFLLKLMLDLSMGGTIFVSLAHHQPAGKTLFLCGEAGMEMMVERTKLLAQDYDEDNIAIYTANDFAQQNIDITLDNHDGISTFKKLVAGEHPDLVIIDTLISFRNDDENASKETSRLFRKLIGIADKNNCAIIISHHVRKRKTSERDLPASQDEIIGSSAITRLAGTAFLLTRADKAAYTKLECVKSWWEQPSSVFWRIKSNNDGTVSIITTDNDDITEANRRCKKYVEAMVVGEGVTAAMLASACACSEHIAGIFLDDYVKHKKLQTVDYSGVQYYLATKPTV